MLKTEKPTIFVVEDDPIICKSLHWLFKSVNLNVETYATADSYLKVHNPYRYGCLLIDIRLPGMSGLQLQEHLAARNNPIPIIIITGHGDVSLAVRAMKMGAKDFILKPYNNDILLEQIHKVLAKDDEYLNIFHENTQRITKLTRREQQIFELMVEGKLNKQIAATFNISISTIEKHRSNIMKKLEVESLAQLVKIHTIIKYCPKFSS